MMIDELGIQTVEICLSTRQENGGMIEFDVLFKKILAIRSKHAGAQEISEYLFDDI